MKHLITLFVIGSASILSADAYQQPNNYRNSQQYYSEDAYPSENGRNGNYMNGQYYQENASPYLNQSNERGMMNYSQDNGNQYQNQNNDRGMNYYQDNGKMGNAKMVSDQEIIKNVHDALSSGWFTKGYENVSYVVKDGIVTLRGTVDTAENKNKAEEKVKGIDGVKQVMNQIVVSKEEPKSQSPAKYYSQDYAATEQDKILNKQIRDRLSSGWFNKGNDKVAVKTTNGVVTISGVVDSYDDIQKVNDQLKDIPGIMTLNNQLSVKKQ